MPKVLPSLLNPKSVAILGASRSPEKVGAIVLKNIQESGYQGQIFPINPNSSEINHIPCFPSFQSLPQTPDLAIIALPSSLVIQSLEEIGQKGTTNVVIYSAGFKEMGAEGVEIENKLIETANKYSLNILGPNCLGFINNLCPINATFGEQVKNQGNLHFISQSGAIATSIFDWCNSIGLGFSSFVTLGNKSILNEVHFLEYILENFPQDHSPIGLYLESISDGKKFLDVTSQLSVTHPIFIIKPGKSPSAAKAMQSHTGAIAGADDVLEAALSQTNIIRCQNLEDFFDLSKSFSWSTPPRGDKIAIISNAGGPAVISADAVSEYHLQLAEFSPDISQKLSTTLPRSASIHNPVDVLGDALSDRYAQAADIILASNQADSLLVILTPQMMTQVKDTATKITQLSQKYQKPVFCSFIGGTLVKEGEELLNQFHLPNFRFPEQAIQVISQMFAWQNFPKINKPSATATSTAASANVVELLNSQRQSSLDSADAQKLISLFKIPTPDHSTPSTLIEAQNFAEKIGYPVVLKLSSPALIHKVKSGGVITNISDYYSLEKAWSHLTEASLSLDSNTKQGLRFILQKQVDSGIEIIVGIKKDPTFGPIVLFGLGGKMLSLISDKNIGILPMNREQISNLISQSKVYSLIKDYPSLSKLTDAIFNFSEQYLALPQISEMEINPIIVSPDSISAVDCKVLLALPNNNTHE